MKRTEFKRKTPMSRGIVASAQREPRDHTLSMQALVDSTLPRRSATYSGATSGEVIEKDNVSQSPSYAKAVRDLGFCMLCGKVCRPQVCHRDETKATGLKTDIRESWAGCSDCHFAVGTKRVYPKAQRRILELSLGLRTRQAVKAAGTWPKRLPAWAEDESK